MRIRDHASLRRPARASALVLIGLAAACTGAGEGTPSQSIPTTMLSDGTQQALPATELTIDDIGFDRGVDEAPIRIVEFSDFGCGYCRRFHTETFPTLLDKYIETGIVKWKYVTYVSGMFPNSLQASFAAECVGEQGLFDDMSQALYEQQGDWKPAGEPYPILEGIAQEAGADMDQYRACVAEERNRERIRSGILIGARLGVRGTPSFLVDGYPLVGAQPLEVWEDVFRIRLEEIEAAEAGGTSGG